ncbi:hypothetical protein [Neolewinella persica]|uniref:hypothetical protein n=1 Tax=Neolewinella persica TaxID=70998 RepID=UPI00036DF7C0|nr:hypothetical protein [Neolewinella persica]
MNTVIDPSLSPTPAADYTSLRATAYAAIERMANEKWTDFNAHDPGITLAEHLADALAEIGYRGSFDIADLLTGPGGGIDHRQPFFTARRIMTNAPVTNADFRRLLIDHLELSNAWAVCKACACAPLLYPECELESLRFAPRWRLLPEGVPDEHEHPVRLKGFTDFYLQFAPDDALGNLNNERVEGQLFFLDEANVSRAHTVEIRIPNWQTSFPSPFADFSAEEAVLAGTTALTSFRRNRETPDNPEEIDRDELVRGWRNIFYCDLLLAFTLDGDTTTIEIPEVTIRIWPGGSLDGNVSGDSVLAAIIESGLMDQYQQKAKIRAEALAQSVTLLHENRRLGEDYCRYDHIKAEDVAVCADLHLTPTADVELTLATFYRTLERLLNPGVPFRTLTELTDRGLTTEEIFNGPALDHGFILEEDLVSSQLREQVYVSDLINELMDIEGVARIENLQFTVYDEDGKPVMPAHTWCIPVSPAHYPALYLAASQVMPYKDGLPLLPRKSELRDILLQLRSADRALALPVDELDFPIPTGIHRAAPSYLPVQRTLPTTYGLSVEGLPADASPLRQAQAQQLAAFLLPFEMMTAATADQLTHFGDLFSTDEQMADTYQHPDLFAAGGPLAHLDGLLADPLTAQDQIAELTESEGTFAERRNRFLDHLLARFGERIDNYSLLIHDQSTRLAYGPEKLIQDKIRFLRFYPEISARRGVGLNYRLGEKVCGYRNRSGIGDRIRRLLGMGDIRSLFELSTQRTPEGWETTWALRDPTLNALVLLPAPAAAPTLFLTAETAEAAAWATIELVIEQATDLTNYRVQGVDVFVTLTTDDGNGPQTTDIALLDGGADALSLQTLVTGQLEQEKLYVVEHLLLRPKFPGDALMNVCLGEDCQHYGLEDPYSFRLTYLLPASAEPFSEDMDLRRYADRLVRQETPVHLLPKVCWIGESLDEFDARWCAWLEANAAFNWPVLNDEMESAVLYWMEANDGPDTAPASRSDAQLLLGYFGDRLREQMALVATANTDPPADLANQIMAAAWPLNPAPNDYDHFGADLQQIAANDPALWAAWRAPDDASLLALRAMLQQFYTPWLTVSFRLHRLLTLFQEMHNVYPTATLHDCEDGDDENPVRLNQTSLGTQSSS